MELIVKKNCSVQIEFINMSRIGNGLITVNLTYGEEIIEKMELEMLWIE